MPLRIRSEEPSDFPAIYSLVRDAFAVAKASDGDEQDFVVAMRDHPGYIPDLALVAEKGPVLAGYILLTKTRIAGPEGDYDALLLAPLCVSPKVQRRGVGAALMKEAFRRARDMGFTAVFLAGDPAYYRRFGFRCAAKFGIRHELAVPDKYILVLELVPGALQGKTGTIILTGHNSCAAATGQTSSRVEPESAPCMTI